MKIKQELLTGHLMCLSTVLFASLSAAQPIPGTTISIKDSYAQTISFGRTTLKGTYFLSTFITGNTVKSINACDTAKPLSGINVKPLIIKTIPVTDFKPGALWQDDHGEVINAHGGGILYHDKTYYWFGEKRGRYASEGVNVYSSKDLYNWKNEGLAFSPSPDPQSEVATGCLMERPKVIYNEKTKKYVMWFHLELKGRGYSAARAAIAVSDKVTGPYTYVNSFRPNGNMSRDMGLFVDDGGAAYQIYSSRENYDMRIVRLSDDYLSATTQDSLLFSNHREGPALFKQGGKYYLITSGCTGWAPNEASLHESASLFGPWKSLGDPMHGVNEALTFDGQSTYVLPVAGKKNAFVFIADRWNPKDLKDSRYLWLPIQFKTGIPFIDWMDQWSLDFFAGRRKVK